MKVSQIEDEIERDYLFIFVFIILFPLIYTYACVSDWIDERKIRKNKLKPNKITLGIIALIFLAGVFVLMSSVSATELKGIQGQCINLPQQQNATYCNITSVQLPPPNSNKVIIGVFMSGSSPDWNYNFCNTSLDGTYYAFGECDKIAWDYSFLITPTGKSISDNGTLSASILYLFFLIGALFIGIGFLFLRNNSVWVSYSGIFLMIIGFAFIYYDMHIGNIYAQTIAINSGVSNIAGGGVTGFIKFIKLAPYIVAGVILFAIVKVLRASIKKRNSKDGWDNNQF